MEHNELNPTAIGRIVTIHNIEILISKHNVENKNLFEIYEIEEFN